MSEQTQPERSVSSVLVVEVSGNSWTFNSPCGDYLCVAQDDGGLRFEVGCWQGISENTSHGVYLPTPVLRSLTEWIGSRR